MKAAAADIMAKDVAADRDCISRCSEEKNFQNKKPRASGAFGIPVCALHLLFDGHCSSFRKLFLHFLRHGYLQHAVFELG